MTTFLRWASLAGGVLLFGGIALASFWDLRAGDDCYIASFAGRAMTFAMFVVSGAVTAGLVAVAAKALRHNAATLDS